MNKIKLLMGFISCFFNFSSWADLGPIRYGGDATVIIDATTISQPGNYRLARDISGTINIAADNVHLDLNNKTITATSYAITITAHKNITIENGILGNATVAAMLINTCTNVDVQNVNFFNNLNGLFSTTTTCMVIKKCNFMNNISALTIENTNNVIVEKSLIKFNETEAEDLDLINVLESHNIVFENVEINDNVLFSNDVMLLQNSSNIKILNSTCNNNVDAGLLINIQFSNPIFISDCEFNKNVTSEIISVNDFVSSVIQASIIEGCRFNKNTCSSVIAVGGFGYIVRNCQAIGNAGIVTVFLSLGSGESNIFQNCVANYNSNSNPFVDVRIFFADDANLKAIFDECVALDNIVSGNLFVFETLNNTDSCILNCLAKRNQSSQVTIGFDIVGGTRCTMRNNIGVDNIGSPSVGFNITPVGGSNVVWSNQSQGHTFDFSGAFIPKVQFNVAAGTFTALPPFTSGRELDNVDVV